MLQAGVRAAIYLRASTDEQAITPDEQREQLHALAAQHGLLVIAEFLDHESGTRKPGRPINRRTGLPSTHPRAKVRRPGLLALLDGVQQRRFHAVLFTDLSRLARRVSLQADLLDAFRKGGVRVLTTEGAVEFQRASDRLVHNIKGAVAEHYADYIGERTRDALRQLRAKRKRYSVVAPFGYRHVPGGTRDDGTPQDRLELDPHEQHVLARMRELRASDLSLRDIAAALNAEGYTTRRGSPWHFAYVHHYLKAARACDVQGAA